MKLQEILDKAYKGVIAQGTPGHDGTRCTYHAVVGGKELRCAVGQLLEGDEVQRVQTLWDASRAIFDRVEEDPGEIATQDGDEFNAFLDQMQRAHDAAAMSSRAPDGFDNELFKRLFKERMNNVASSYGLKTPEVT